MRYVKTVNLNCNLVVIFVRYQIRAHAHFGLSENYLTYASRAEHCTIYNNALNHIKT
jgi:hypothetical protein